MESGKQGGQKRDWLSAHSASESEEGGEFIYLVAPSRPVAVQLQTNQLSLRLGDGANAISIELPARLVHRGSELKLVIPSGTSPDRKPDPVLVKLVVLARVAQQAPVRGEPDPLVSHYSKRHLWQLLRISWLAPDIIAAVVGGTQPATLTGRRLLRATDIPLDWKAQRAHFQFD